MDCFAACPGGLSVVEDKFFGQDGAVCTVLAWKEGKQYLENKEKMGVSENSGTPKSSILIGFSIIFTIHFGVPLFSETSKC